MDASLAGQALLFESAGATCERLGVPQCQENGIPGSRDRCHAGTAQVAVPKRANVGKMVLIRHTEEYG